MKRTIKFIAKEATCLVSFMIGTSALVVLIERQTSKAREAKKQMKKTLKIGYVAIKILGAFIWIGALGNTMDAKKK